MNNCTTTYTLIAYRADGFEISMGCTTGTSSSDHEIHISRKLEDLIEPMAKLMFSDLLKDAYSDFCFTLLSDGERAGDRPYNKLFNAAREGALEMLDAYNAAKRSLAESQAKEAQEKKDTEERALYLHLQDKYGDK